MPTEKPDYPIVKSELPSRVRARPVCTHDGTKAVELLFLGSVAVHVQLVPLDSAPALAETLMAIHRADTEVAAPTEPKPKPMPDAELVPQRQTVVADAETASVQSGD